MILSVSIATMNFPCNLHKNSLYMHCNRQNANHLRQAIDNITQWIYLKKNNTQLKNIVHLTYTGNHYSMALGGAVLIWSCGLEGKSRGVLTGWATGTWCRYLQQSLNSLSDAREPLFLQNQLRWTQCVLVGFDRGRGEKQNTNISLFTEKVHNISNKTSWHKQMIQGKLVLVLQAIKICKYRLLRGDAKGWSALSVNKQDPRLIMKSFPCTAYKDCWEMQLPSVISMIHNMQGSPQVQTGSHAQEALVTHGQCIQQNTWSKNHFFVLPTISHSSESPSFRDAAMRL